ncbi:MAG TPA: SDR family NAD(P)-dependent oxidoreductase, partial [Sphingopyxis sp.]|nr:SDR family NAD(P)-dependent oxidoreductase [Sphingopyxis sp.]
MDISGKLALVTGGSNGIGREIALQLQGAGAEVIVTGRSADKLQAMAGLGFGTIASDLSNAEGVDAVVNGVAGKPLSLLVNNAGVGSDYDLDKP